MFSEKRPRTAMQPRLWHLNIHLINRMAMPTVQLAKVLAILLSVILLPACSLKPQKTIEAEGENINYGKAALYQLYINSKGELVDPNKKGSPVDNPDDYVTAILENIKLKKAAKRNLSLTIYIHGGLNTFRSSTSRVNASVDAMLAAGQYPLFISWDSTGVGNYFEHLIYLRRGTRKPVLGPLSAPFVFLEDALRAAARIPSSTYNEISNLTKLPKSLYTSDEGAVDQSERELRQQEGFDLRDHSAKTGLRFRDFATITNPVKFLTAPFVDGLGAGAWHSMLHRTDFVLRRSNAYDGITTANESSQKDEQKEERLDEASVYLRPDKPTISASETAVSSFLRRFSSAWSGRSTDPIKIRLIAHSMGTIISNKIIRQYPDLDYDDVVYFGAACRLKDIEQTISPLLRDRETVHFYNLSIDPYQELAENLFYDFLPRGSLLVWIDQTLGVVDSFDDRTAGRWSNIVRAANKIFPDPKTRNRIHLTRFGINDKTPQTHGDFDEYEFWREGYWTNATGEVVRR